MHVKRNFNFHVSGKAEKNSFVLVQCMVIQQPPLLEQLFQWPSAALSGQDKWENHRISSFCNVILTLSFLSVFPLQYCPKMMERTALLALYCLLMPISCSPLYPSLKFGHRATSILMSSTLENPLQLPNTNYRSSQTLEAVLRSGRHADAIFTNSYRKVLGQISARKLLQSVMGKRLGREDTEHFDKRQSGIHEDTFKQDLTAIQKEERYRGQQQDIQRLRNFRVPWS
ncbi:hypothetical protein ACEWY4_013035 [Coilia grayii]|uniref:Somatoliberin n=1 Tax=Coilia grayii TaxID=363190 RepID=A0ABD1JVA1_9TELE